jgi:uncharacterized protein YuzE
MKLIYTEHVLRRMAKRQLREEWIVRVVESPARIEPDEVDATLEHPAGDRAGACQPGVAGYCIERRTEARHHRAPGPETERKIMKLTIDRKADALYLDLDEAPAVESEEISPGVIFDYNASGKVVGIEMLYLSKRVSPEKIGRMQMETVEA